MDENATATDTISRILQKDSKEKTITQLDESDSSVNISKILQKHSKEYSISQMIEIDLKLPPEDEILNTHDQIQ